MTDTLLVDALTQTCACCDERGHIPDGRARRDGRQQRGAGGEVPAVLGD